MQSQRAGSKPTRVPPALLRARWPENSLGAPRLRANRRTKCLVGVALLDTRWKKSAVPHRKEIAAPCRLPVVGTGRSIRPIARAVRRRPGASAPLRSPEDQTTGAPVEEAPVPLVAREMQAAARAPGFPQWQCFAVKRSPRVPRADVRAPLRLTTSIAKAAPSGFPPAENIYR